MKKQNHTAVALLIAGLIVLAVLASFFGPFFFGQTPSVVLPDITAPSGSSTPGGGDIPGGDYVRVEVTPETVQSVIATLTRPQSYYRELTVKTFWAEEADQGGSTKIEVWADGGVTRVDSTLADGTMRHSIVKEGRIYIWYGSDRRWFETNADELSADLAQNIPSYETVLELDTAAITDTGYVVLDSKSCIYVEARDDVLGYLERYWVEVQSGLLVAAETVKDGTAVYRMTSGLMESPIPQDASFALPDGTVLHALSQT